MTLEEFLAIAISITAISTGLIVLLKAPRQLVNQLFFAFTMSFTIWAASYLLIEASDNLSTATLLNKMSLCFVISTVSLFALLTYLFPKRKKIPKVQKVLLLALTCIGMAISFTDFVAGDVTISEDGVYMYEFTVGTAIHTLMILAFLPSVFINLSRDYKNSNARIHKSQIRYMLFGLLAGVLIGVALMTFVSYAFPTTRIDDLATLSILLIIIFTGRAIVQRRLFDLRVGLARFFAVMMSLALIIAGYFALYYSIQRFLLRDQDSAQLATSVVVILFIILFYKTINTTIRSRLYRVLFTKNYNPERLLEELNQNIVAETELKPLLEKTSKLVEKNLDASFCSFYIRETAYFSSRFIASKKKLTLSDLEKIRQLTPTIKSRVHSAELEPITPEERLLSDVLQKNNIEVLGRLVSTINYDVAGVGYIVLGPKKSSSVYSEQDLRILEIVANELVIAVENALRLEEIEQFNVTLQKKIDEATKELKDSNKKLLALDEAKDEFVSMASHQLRTPLTSIKGYISMVLEGDAGDISDTQKKMLGQAFFSSQRMVYLISDLLNVSRLKTGKFIIEPKPVNLADLVESELQQLQEGAGAKNQTLSFTKPKSFPTLSLDEMKIRQVVMNFTDNAIYYTPVGGKISIDLKNKKDSVEFTVKDTGIGVPKKEQHKLFAKFYRAENARKARPDGTGLGLFMAKKVIVAQGGAIIFHSKEGKGSTFGFTFPKEKLEITKPADLDTDKA